jgi:hypothetical protein
MLGFGLDGVFVESPFVVDGLGAVVGAGGGAAGHGQPAGSRIASGLG